MKESSYSPIHVNQYNLLFHWDRIQTILRKHDQYVEGEEVPPLPVTVEVNPMDFCNHGCVWCFTKSHRQSDRMRKDILQLLLKQLKSGGVKSIHFAGGGESSLYKGLLPRVNTSGSLVDDLCDDNDITLGLITNGSVFQLLDIDRIASLFSWIRFSVDAGTESRYQTKHLPNKHGLSEVTSNIDALIQARGNRIYPIIGSSFIFEKNGPEVYDDVLTFAHTMKKIGVDYIQIKPENHNRSDDSLSFLASLKKDLPEILADTDSFAALHTPHDQTFNSDYCWYSYFGAVVGATGGVYACCYTYGQEDFKYGKLDESQDFKSLWHSERRRDLAASIIPTNCPSCRHNHLNMLVERLSGLSRDQQDELTNILSQLKSGKSLCEIDVSGSLQWLEPGFDHIEQVIAAGYNRIIDFPAYRDTDFIEGDA